MISCYRLFGYFEYRACKSDVPGVGVHRKKNFQEVGPKCAGSIFAWIFARSEATELADEDVGAEIPLLPL